MRTRTRKRKAKARPILAATAAAAALAAVMVYTDQSSSASGARSAAQAAPAQRAAGAVVVRDPQTGELREPTPQELLALTTPPPGRFSLQAAPSAPLPIVSPTGFDGLQLGEEQMTYTVATRKADGTVAISHAAGKTEADRQVAAGQRGLVAGKERVLDR